MLYTKDQRSVSFLNLGWLSGENILQVKHFDACTLCFLKSWGGKSQPSHPSDYTPEDRGAFLFWRGSLQYCDATPNFKPDEVSFVFEFQWKDCQNNRTFSENQQCGIICPGVYICIALSPFFFYYIRSWSWMKFWKLFKGSKRTHLGPPNTKEPNISRGDFWNFDQFPYFLRDLNPGPLAP